MKHEPVLVRVPYRRLPDTLPRLLERGLAPEITFKGPELDTLERAGLRRFCRALTAAGVRPTVHAPFHDLNPGALEPLVGEATRRRFEQALEAGAELGARLVVFHPGYDQWKYGGQDHLWLERNLSFWPPFLRRAADLDCRLALENIFEPRPDTLAELLETLDSPWLGHCFDAGHWRLFAEVPLEAWFARLGSHLMHLHLHDNTGRRDDHLPPGEGDIDFAALFRQLEALPRRPSLTLEVNDPAAVDRALAALAPYVGV